MQKVRITSFTAIAGLVVGVAVVSSASAASWKVNKALLSGSAALAVTAQVTEAGKLTFSTVTVECTGATVGLVAPQITHPDSVSASSLTLTSCIASGGNCALVGTTVTSVPIVALASVVGTTVLAVTKPKTKTVFATIEMSGASCAFASEVQPLTGTMLSTAPTGGTENTFQELVANTTSGELKVGSSAGTLKLKCKLRLVSGATWSFA